MTRSISSDGVQTDTIPSRDSIRKITTCTGLPKIDDVLNTYIYI